MSWRALVVDDDPSIRLVLEHALAGDGCEVTVAEDGADVAELVDRIPFDLVVLDLYMPGKNGFEVLRNLREPPHGMLPPRRTPSTVKVMVLTAHSDPETVTFVLKRGADLCLAKPFDVADLLQAARRLVGGTRGRKRG